MTTGQKAFLGVSITAIVGAIAIIVHERKQRNKSAVNLTNTMKIQRREITSDDDGIHGDFPDPVLPTPKNPV